jgi:hypothetical protein
MSKMTYEQFAQAVKTIAEREGFVPKYSGCTGVTCDECPFNTSATPLVQTHCEQVSGYYYDVALERSSLKKLKDLYD